MLNSSVFNRLIMKLSNEKALLSLRLLCYLRVYLGFFTAENTEKAQRKQSASCKLHGKSTIPKKNPSRVVFFDTYGRKVKELSYLKKIGIQDLNYGIYYILVVDVDDRIILKEKFIRRYR